MDFQKIFIALSKIPDIGSGSKGSPKAESTYLVSPLIEFLALGGGSLIFLLFLKLWGQKLPQQAAGARMNCW